MFQDVDATLRAVLIADVPIKKTEVEIAFDRPNRDWSSRLSRPTLNLFLFDIRERAEMKDDVPIVTRDGNGRAVRQRPPRRLDLSYLVSAWTTEPDDEVAIFLAQQSKSVTDVFIGRIRLHASEDSGGNVRGGELFGAAFHQPAGDHGRVGDQQCVTSAETRGLRPKLLARAAARENGGRDVELRIHDHHPCFRT